MKISLCWQVPCQDTDLNPPDVEWFIESSDSACPLHVQTHPLSKTSVLSKYMAGFVDKSFLSPSSSTKRNQRAGEGEVLTMLRDSSVAQKWAVIWNVYYPHLCFDTE